MKSLLLLLALSVCLPVVAQDSGPAVLTPKPPADATHEPPKITQVTAGYDKGRKITRLWVELQKAPNNMEPVAEPRDIRIDDRSNVQFELRNLSPLDVCTRTASAPTANTETAPIESITSTVAGLGGIAGATNAEPNGQPSGAAAAMIADSAGVRTNDLAIKEQDLHVDFLNAISKLPPSDCKAKNDKEFSQFEQASRQFFDDAPKFIGKLEVKGGKAKCPDDRLAKKKATNKDYQPSQVELTCEIDADTRELVDYPRGDFRGGLEGTFKVADNDKFEPTRIMFTNPIETIAAANALQAKVDLMKAYAADLHKKYDYQPPSTTGSDSPAMPAVIPGALMGAPTGITFTKKGDQQKLSISSGGTAGTFTAVPSSDSGWLLLATTADAKPSGKQLQGTAPDQGVFTLLVSVDNRVIDGGTHYGSILLTGTGHAKGSTIINVVVKPASGPTDCDLTTLHHMDADLDKATDVLSTISDINKSLQASQTALKTSYLALVRVENDYKRRISQHIVMEIPDTNDDEDKGKKILVQEFNLGTDRKNTSPGYFSCVSDLDMTTATTTNINYTLLYQDVPHWSTSIGFLVSFQPNQIIGIADTNTGTTSSPIDTQYFTATTRTPVQFIPMAYLNYRLGGYKSTLWGSTKENELVWTFNPSAGFGVNPNSGTNQPEFFGGFAIGWNHFLLHPGVHVGHTQSLGGGYTFASPVPSGLTTAPITWAYHFKFSIGFSVRVAPY